MKFAAEWGATAAGWRTWWETIEQGAQHHSNHLVELAREDELIVVGDTAMIPDFSFTHRKDGRRALLDDCRLLAPLLLEAQISQGPAGRTKGSNPVGL